MRVAANLESLQRYGLRGPEPAVAAATTLARLIVCCSLGEALAGAAVVCEASVEELEIGAPHPKTGKPIVRQDPDVLDTWASSWLWPIATLGWPEPGAADLARFYPTQFLSTASGRCGQIVADLF